jgi:hypothetical protein
MIEITTIGAGGGSIAHVDAGGCSGRAGKRRLRPGPVCYGQGGDAADADRRQRGARPDQRRPPHRRQARAARRGGARAAIARHIGEPLGLGAEAAAEAILRVANANMAGAIRLVSIERGHDPARFALAPFGGGGALHAGALIAETGLRSALVPRYPGVTSALGCLIADIRHDRVATVNLMLDGLDAAALDARMTAEGRAAHAAAATAGLPVEGIEVRFELDMHYVGQTHTVAVPLPVTWTEAGTGVTEAAVRAAFEAAYRAAFARLLPGIPVKIVNLRTAGIGRRPRFDLAALAPARRRRWTPPAAGPAGLVRRRLHRGGGVGPPRPAGGRRDRRARHPRAARRHHGGRPRPDRASRRARQPDPGARHDPRRPRPRPHRAAARDLQNDFLHPEGAYGRGRPGGGDRGAARAPAPLAARGGQGRAGRRHALHAGPRHGGRADHLAAPEGDAAVPARGDFAPGSGASARSTSSSRWTWRSRRSPIPPST